MEDYSFINESSSIEIPGARAAVQTVNWEFDQETEIELDCFLFSSPLSPLRLHERTLWRFQDSKRPFRASLFGLMPAHFPVNCSRAKGPVRTLFCAVEPGYFRQVTGFDSLTTEQVVMTLQNNGAFFRTLLGRLADEVIQPGFASAELVSSLVHCLLVETARMIQGDTRDHSETQLSEWQMRKVREAITESLAENQLTIESLGALCGISGRHLMRGFKAATGMTVHGYIEQIRLERTKRLLTEGDAQLKEIAALAGFSSASHLSAAFKKLTGLQPSEYRRKNRRHTASSSILH